MPSLLRYRRTAFGVCLDLIGGETLASNQSLYLRASTRKAAPKCIYSYPHLIQKLFNAYWCGPPSGVTRTSSWTRVDHLVSRLPHQTVTPYSDSLSLRLRASKRLTSPDMATRRFIMQKARRHSISCSDRL